ncbi:hypothetical protein BH11BAC4_BH11BAC4_02790 [soil metagenome]
MNIDRHNYETIFLLYVDNELSATDRKTVEQFVQENADLKPELELLLDSTLPVEGFSYGSTEQLYRNEIELDNLQEQLLMHLDNELDNSSKKEIERQIGSENNVKKEWQLWQQTKLDADEQIIFNDKKSLYRHERSHVISMRTWRMIAAAAILLIGLFTGVSILKKDNSTETSTARNQPTSQGNKRQVAGKNESVAANNTAASSNNSTEQHIAASKAVKEKDENNPPTAIAPDRNNITTDNKDNDNNIVVDKKENNNKPVIDKTSLENINKQGSNNSNTATVLNNKRNEVVSPERAHNEIAVVPVREKVTAPTSPIIDYNSIPPMPDSYAKTASVNEGSPENNNKIVYMNEETVSRSKVGGIFRKVKRVIERNANINTGKGVKIAGFEIALK